MIRNLAVYGAGGMGREIALMIDQINALQQIWNFVGFFDDNKSKGTQVGDFRILGGITELNSHREDLSLVVSIADPRVRAQVVNRIQSTKIDFPALVHPSCWLGKSTRFGKGCVITAGCILTTDISLGDFTIINLSSTIGHDVVLGDYCSIMPGCNISGNVKIGKNTLVGTGVKILQNIMIGANCVIGAGAVVTKNFGDNAILVGVPAALKTM